MITPIGLTAFGLTCLTILTGIMDQLPEGSCYYITGSTEYNADYNPGSNIAYTIMNIISIETGIAGNYSMLPTACQIANGLGVTVVFASLMTISSVIYRSPPEEEVN